MVISKQWSFWAKWCTWVIGACSCFFGRAQYAQATTVSERPSSFEQDGHLLKDKSVILQEEEKEIEKNGEIGWLVDQHNARKESPFVTMKHEIIKKWKQASGFPDSFLSFLALHPSSEVPLCISELSMLDHGCCPCHSDVPYSSELLLKDVFIDKENKLIDRVKVSLLADTGRDALMHTLLYYISSGRLWNDRFSEVLPFCFDSVDPNLGIKNDTLLEHYIPMIRGRGIYPQHLFDYCEQKKEELLLILYGTERFESLFNSNEHSLYGFLKRVLALPCVVMLVQEKGSRPLLLWEKRNKELFCYGFSSDVRKKYLLEKMYKLTKEDEEIKRMSLGEFRLQAKVANILITKKGLIRTLSRQPLCLEAFPLLFLSESFDQLADKSLFSLLQYFVESALCRLGGHRNKGLWKEDLLSQYETELLFLGYLALHALLDGGEYVANQHINKAKAIYRREEEGIFENRTLFSETLRTGLIKRIKKEDEVVRFTSALLQKWLAAYFFMQVLPEYGSKEIAKKSSKNKKKNTLDKTIIFQYTLEKKYTPTIRPVLILAMNGLILTSLGVQGEDEEIKILERKIYKLFSAIEGENNIDIFRKFHDLTLLSPACAPGISDENSISLSKLCKEIRSIAFHRVGAWISVWLKEELQEESVTIDEYGHVLVIESVLASLFDYELCHATHLYKNKEVEAVLMKQINTWTSHLPKSFHLILDCLNKLEKLSRWHVSAQVVRGMLGLLKKDVFWEEKKSPKAGVLQEKMFSILQHIVNKPGKYQNEQYSFFILEEMLKKLGKEDVIARIRVYELMVLHTSKSTFFWKWIKQEEALTPYLGVIRILSCLPLPGEVARELVDKLHGIFTKKQEENSHLVAMVLFEYATMSDEHYDFWKASYARCKKNILQNPSVVYLFESLIEHYQKDTKKTEELNKMLHDMATSKKRSKARALAKGYELIHSNRVLTYDEISSLVKNPMQYPLLISMVRKSAPYAIIVVRSWLIALASKEQQEAFFYMKNQESTPQKRTKKSTQTKKEWLDKLNEERKEMLAAMKHAIVESARMTEALLQEMERIMRSSKVNEGFLIEKIIPILTEIIEEASLEQAKKIICAIINAIQLKQNKTYVENSKHSDEYVDLEEKESEEQEHKQKRSKQNTQPLLQKTIVFALLEKVILPAVKRLPALHRDLFPGLLSFLWHGESEKMILNQVLVLLNLAVTIHSELKQKWLEACNDYLLLRTRDISGAKIIGKYLYSWLTEEDAAFVDIDKIRGLYTTTVVRFGYDYLPHQKKDFLNDQGHDDYYHSIAQEEGSNLNDILKKVDDKKYKDEVLAHPEIIKTTVSVLGRLSFNDKRQMIKLFNFYIKLIKGLGGKYDAKDRKCSEIFKAIWRSIAQKDFSQEPCSEKILKEIFDLLLADWRRLLTENVKDAFGVQNALLQIIKGGMLMNKDVMRVVEEAVFYIKQEKIPDEMKKNLIMFVKVSMETNPVGFSDKEDRDIIQIRNAILPNCLGQSSELNRVCIDLSVALLLLARKKDFAQSIWNIWKKQTNKIKSKDLDKEKIQFLFELLAKNKATQMHALVFWLGRKNMLSVDFLGKQTARTPKKLIKEAGFLVKTFSSQKKTTSTPFYTRLMVKRFVAQIPIQLLSEMLYTVALNDQKDKIEDVLTLILLTNKPLGLPKDFLDQEPSFLKNITNKIEKVIDRWGFKHPFSSYRNLDVLPSTLSVSSYSIRQSLENGSNFFEDEKEDSLLGRNRERRVSVEIPIRVHSKKLAKDLAEIFQVTSNSMDIIGKRVAEKLVKAVFSDKKNKPKISKSSLAMVLGNENQCEIKMTLPLEHQLKLVLGLQKDVSSLLERVSSNLEKITLICDNAALLQWLKTIKNN